MDESAEKSMKESEEVRGKNSLDERLLLDTLGTLVSTGVPILQSLKITKEAFPAYGPEIQHIHDSINKGESIAHAMRKYPDSFNPIVYPLLEVGEETGAFPEMLMHASDFLKKEMDYGVDSKKEIESKELSKLFFFNCMYTCIDAGLPLLYALRRVSKLPSLNRMKLSLEKICDSIEEGDTLSEAMRKNGQASFDSFDVNMIKAGECGGVLEIALQRLADYTERRYFSEKTPAQN